MPQVWLQSKPRVQAAFAALALLLAAAPVLLPHAEPPIVTAVGELLSVGVWGLLALLIGAHTWQHAPLRVAGLGPATPLPSPWPRLVIGTAAVAGMGSAVVALFQVLAPQALNGPIGEWIQPSHLPGRAVGHLRQPNHLATVLLWGVVAWVVLHTRRHISLSAAACACSLLVWALVLSGSRTGLLGLGVLVAWGLADRRLAGSGRALLIGTPVLAAVAWVVTLAWSRWAGLPFGAVTHLSSTSEGDVSSSRFAIWRNTWALIEQHLWGGVGTGHFNIAWTLTPMTQRPTALFDHAHNLPLHLMAEWGLPLGLGASLVLAGLMLTGLRRSWATTDDSGPWRRGGAVMLLLVGLHSLLEYPLWYAYFALPSLAALGITLNWDHSSPRGARWQALILMAGGSALMIASAWAYADYRVVREIYAPASKSGTLAERMTRGQERFWFADHAHYAMATTVRPQPGHPWTPEMSRAFERAPHVLLDSRLMMAWADALAARKAPGDLDRARHIAARLREFNPPSARDWLDDCATPSQPPERRWVCETPETTLSWKQVLN